MSNRCNVIDFEPEHLLHIDFGRPEMRLLSSMGDLVAYGRRLSKHGPAYTAIGPDGVILGCSGVGQLFPWGVWELWACLSSRFDAYPVTLHRMAKRGVAWIMDELKPQRLQVRCPAFSVRAAEWLMRLGFEVEATLRAAEPDGGDSVMLVILGRDK